MKPTNRKQSPQQPNAIKDAVVPKLMDQIMSLRAQVTKLKAELEQLKLSSIRTEAKKITFRNGVQQ